MTKDLTQGNVAKTLLQFAYIFSPVPAIGVSGIWWAIPIGWFLADLTGILYLRKSLPTKNPNP